MRRPMHPPADWRTALTAVLADADSRFAALPLEPLGAGLDFWAFALGDDLVVRCPQHAEGAANLRVEQRVVPLIAPRIPARLAIPLPVASAPNPLGPGDLAVVSRVPGRIVDEVQWHRRRLIKDHLICNSIAALIEAIGSVSVADVVAAGAPIHNRRRHYGEQLSRIVSDVSPRLADDRLARRLEHSYAVFVADDANFGDDLTVIHADISLDHLLLTDDAVTGLIDFGDVCIDDPDYELSYLFAEGGADFVGQIQACRGRGLTERLVDKLTFFALADAVTDVLWAIDYADDDLYAESLALTTCLLETAR